MPVYSLPCLTCTSPYEVNAPDMSGALLAGRAAGQACPSCRNEAALFAAGIATVAIDEAYDVALVPPRLVIPEPDAIDDVVRAAFVAARAASPG
jgi:hypothetical protein